MFSFGFLGLNSLSLESAMNFLNYHISSINILILLGAYFFFFYSSGLGGILEKGGGRGLYIRNVKGGVEKEAGGLFNVSRFILGTCWNGGEGRYKNKENTVYT